MTRPLALAAAVAALLACAQAPAPKQSWSEVVGPPSAGPAEGTSLAMAPHAPGASDVPSALSKGDACEVAARRQLAAAPDKAWAALKGCVERSRFLSLPRLLEGGWTEELRRRTDAPLLLARLVAARGGNTVDDLATLRQARVPLFGLETAMTTPEMYAGRTLIFRARVEAIKLLPGNKVSARLAQVELGTKAKFVDTGRGLRVNTSSQVSRSGSAQGAYEARDDNERHSGSFSARRSSDGSVDRHETATIEVRRFVNELHETGRSVILRMGAVDPFFEPGKDFVVVGRFDGVRQEASGDMEQAETHAVISLHAFFEAATSLE